MPLVTANQFDLVPQFSNIGAGIAQGMQLRGQFDQRQQQQQQFAAQQTQQQQLSQFAPQALAGDQEALTKVAGIDPNLALSLQKIMANQDDATNKEMLRENENMTRGALSVLDISGGDPAKARVALQNLEKQWSEQGLSTDLTKGALALDDVGMMRAIKDQAAKGLEIGQYAKSVLLPSQKKQTSLQQNLQAAGIQEGTPEYREAILASITKPQTQISIGGDKKFQEKLSEQHAKTVGRVGEEADAAIDANQSLDVMSNIDVETGALEPLKQGMAAFATSFGLDGSKLANVSAGEAFNAEAQRLVLSVKASQKGPQTDRDEATIRETVANLGNTKEGNKFIITSAKALNNRRIERKDFYDNFIQDSGGNFRNEEGKTADQAWAEFKRGVPMVSPKMRTPEGLPVFFFEFEDMVRGANPDATRQEIIEAWKARNGGKK